MAEGIRQNGKKFQARDCLRMTSISCATRPEEQALVYMRAGDLRSFTDLLNTEEVQLNASQPSHWINQPLVDGGEGAASLLELAVSEGRHQEAGVLVEMGALPDHVASGASSGLSPLHVAVARGDLAMLKLLLKNREEVDINVPAASYRDGLTPLHLAAEGGGRTLACLVHLLQFDEIEVDAKDVRGVKTPLFLAVKAVHEPSVKLLIEHGASLDARCGRATVREYLKEALPHLQLEAIVVKRQPDLLGGLKDTLFKLVKETELDSDTYAAQLGQFKTYLRFFRRLAAADMTAVAELACAKGLHEHLHLLLARNTELLGAVAPGVLEAAFYGHADVLSVLKRHGCSFSGVRPATRETVLHLVLKAGADGVARDRYAACLDLLLAPEEDDIYYQLRQLVNWRDELGNTPLHLATQRWDQGVVRRLLQMGANIGIKNFWQDIPISKIHPSTMESFLNEHCLTSKGDVMHENFEITFRYDFLAPDREALPLKYQHSKEPETEHLKSSQHVGRNKAPPLPETDSLWYMSQSKDHRHLLKHPVITSFLWFKWQRLRRYFNRNLRFYLLFTYILTWFIFNGYGSTSRAHATDLLAYAGFILLFAFMVGFIIRDWISDVNDYRRNQRLEHRKQNSTCSLVGLVASNWVEAVFILFMLAILIFHHSHTSILPTSLLILTIVLVLRELLQVSVSVKRYLSSFENLVELTLICLTFVLLFTSDPERFELNRHLAAIAILLSWGELIVLVGVHPKLTECNIYVTMFLRVLKTFFLFLAWYSLFIVAFGLGFFILLHTDRPEIEPQDDPEPYVFFNQTWLSIVKTTTMFVGELEFSDLPFNLESPLAPLSYAFFLSFVFLIVVVLMNLLNGLAVSDTGIIREKAEIFSYMSKVETISTLESMLLGDPFDFLSNVPALLSSLPSCSLFRQLYRSRAVSQIFTKIGAGEILLFYKYLPEKSVTIHPNKNKDDCFCLRVDDMGRDILASAKQIILRSQHNQAASSEPVVDNQLISKVAQLESQLVHQAAERQNQLIKKVSQLEHQLTAVQAKLDRLLNRFDGV